MGVQQDLRKARRHQPLDGRHTVEVIREGGTVREVRSTPLVEPPGEGSIADIPFTNAAEAPEAVVARRRDGGQWQRVTAAAFAAEVTAVAKGLIAAGLEPGGRVAVMSRTRYEWAVLDFAIWTAGGVTVPVYPTSSSDQTGWILSDSDTRFLVMEGTAHASVLAHAQSSPHAWQLDDGALAELSALGADITDAEVAERRAALGPDSIATLVYTSGTTGQPKGCVLTHRNLHAGAANVVELLNPVFEEITGQAASTLLFLPLAHILGRTIQIACLLARIEIGHCPSLKPSELRPELESFAPTFLVGVPYLFEKIHETGRATAENMGRGSSFERADRIAAAYGEATLRRLLGTGPGPGPGLRLARLLYDLLVFRRIRKALGGHVRYAISGGSPLDRRLNLFFFGCGIVIYEGYGLTETTAAATLIPPLSPRPGTVGRPIPGTTIRLADDGEVLVKGGIVVDRYWNNAEASHQAVRDSWFHTGDLGALDDDGYLTITGRKKDILITTGGKNVSPSVLEDRLRGRSLIGQCMVVGDNRPFIAALITLDPDALAHWLTTRGRPLDTPWERLREDEELRAQVQRAVDYANEAVSRAESIRAFALAGGEFTEENGLLTPSMKVRRQAVAVAHADEIERLYRR